MKQYFLAPYVLINFLVIFVLVVLFGYRDADTKVNVSCPPAVSGCIAYVEAPRPGNPTFFSAKYVPDSEIKTFAAPAGVARHVNVRVKYQGWVMNKFQWNIPHWKRADSIEFVSLHEPDDKFLLVRVMNSPTFH